MNKTLANRRDKNLVLFINNIPEEVVSCVYDPDDNTTSDDDGSNEVSQIHGEEINRT